MARPNLKVMDENSMDQSWKLLGAGGFGQVWKAKHLRWGFDVAVKILGLDNGLHSNEDLVKEVDFMLHGECQYVMRAVGVFRGCRPTTAFISVGLVMENMERGSLSSLQKNLQHLPPWPLVFRLTHEGALGMNYLHCLEPALFHKDLKPDNILLDYSLNAKITDFGLARLSGNVTTTRLQNYKTVPFAPPEASEGGATYAYDVYSYAMVLYSILHNGHMAIGTFDDSRGERPSLEDVKRMKVAGLEKLVDLMVKCLDQTPDQRPPFTECIAVTVGLPQIGINDAVHQVQNELDGVIVPVVLPSAELQLQEDKMAEMRVESRSTNAELQLQKDKGLEKENAGPGEHDELRRIQQYEVNVTLDPDTAHPKLILSGDGKQVSHGKKVRKNLPDSTERFTRYNSVLGKQVFSSGGRFYYEVQVGGKTKWDLGVARESIDREGLVKLSPNNGYWTIGLRHGNEYSALAGPSVVLDVRKKVQTVGVFVDYEEGLVSFHDVKSRVNLYSSLAAPSLRDSFHSSVYVILLMVKN